MTVRPYTETDFPAVCAIYLDAKHDELVFEGRPFEIIPLERDAAILAAVRESDVLVVEQDSGAGLAGFAAAYGGWLRALFIGSAARGQGAGAALLHAVLAAADGPVFLNVARSNRPAQRFYDRHGFHVVGKTVRRYGGNDVAYLIMQIGILPSPI